MEKEPLKVVVMGLGYIGLPTAALIASKGVKVYGVDIKKETVDMINKGKIHIVEPDLEGLVYEVVKKNFLKAHMNPVKSDVFLIAVPTPLKNKNIPDISYVRSAIKSIIPYIEAGNLIIIESTVPIGTTEQMYDLIANERPDLKDEIYVAYCPERVLPGKILYELVHNDRIIGGINKESTIKAKEFYSLFVKGSLYGTDVRTAEMCKLVENAYRDVNIAFANELSILAQKVNIDVWELINLANKHPRVNILQPGVGVGGHCIAIDPWFLIHDFPNETKLLQTARKVNLYKTEWVIKKIENTIKEFESTYNRKPKVACLGITYKPDVDDLRESPALYIVDYLKNKGYNILVVEPNINNKINNVEICGLEEALSKSDIVVILVAHSQFKNINFSKYKNKQILDFVGIVQGKSYG